MCVCVCVSPTLCGVLTFVDGGGCACRAVCDRPRAAAHVPRLPSACVCVCVSGPSWRRRARASAYDYPATGHCVDEADDDEKPPHDDDATIRASDDVLMTRVFGREIDVDVDYRSDDEDDDDPSRDDACICTSSTAA